MVVYFFVEDKLWFKVDMFEIGILSYFKDLMKIYIGRYRIIIIIYCYWYVSKRKNGIF